MELSWTNKYMKTYFLEVNFSEEGNYILYGANSRGICYMFHGNTQPIQLSNSGDQYFRQGFQVVNTCPSKLIVSE